MPRDRDETGRPRNSRPRDRLGRPLPRGAESQLAQLPPAPSPEQALHLAERLIAEGQPFLAHEVCEQEWRSGRRDAALWRGLAQLAVGLTHLQRGNLPGAVSLLLRGANTVDDAHIPAALGVADDLSEQARRLARRLTDHGLPAQPVTLRLCACARAAP
ncbi:MAG: DUF309 domain-containing protein [Mycobacteriales bacterium]